MICDQHGAGQDRKPRRWLWVVRPDYYLDEDGHERKDLEPSAGFEPTAWWTCSAETRMGDTALLYRSTKYKDIAYFAVVRSNPEKLDLPGDEFHGRHVCQYEILERFSKPIPWAAVKADDVLSQWGAVKVRFVRSSFPVPDDCWARLVALAGRTPEQLAMQAVDGIYRIRREREIQDRMARADEPFKDVGLTGLRLVKSEYRFANGRRADLIYEQGRGLYKRDVIVELKRGLIDDRAVEQVLDYAELLRQVPGRPRRRPLTIVIGDDLHPTAEAMVGRWPSRPRFIALSDLGFARDRP